MTDILREAQIKKTLYYLPNHQRVSEYYIAKEGRLEEQEQEEIIVNNYSIENSLNILKTTYPDLYDTLSEKIIKKINGKKTTEEEEDFIAGASVSDTDSDTETGSENEFSDEYSQDDKYETESDFSV